MLAVQVLRGGDEDGVDGLVVQQVAVVEVGLDVGDDALHRLQALGVDVGRAHELGIGAGHRLAQDLEAAVAGADDAQADAVVGAEDVRRSQRSGQTGGEPSDESAAGLHKYALLSNYRTVEKTIIYSMVALRFPGASGNFPTDAMMETSSTF